jgi:flagellar basal body-associated protein FliL
LKPELEAKQRLAIGLRKELNDYLEEGALKDVELL